MYYITRKDSDTGKKFMDLKAKIKKVNNDANKVAKEFNSEKYWQNRWSIAGGIEALEIEGEVTSPALRKEKSHKNMYVPNLRKKEGKELQERFNQLPVVSKKELNTIVNHNDAVWSNIGYNFNNPDYVGFIVEEKWNVEVPDDCEEITTTRYKELFT